MLGRRVAAIVGVHFSSRPEWRNKASVSQPQAITPKLAGSGQHEYLPNQNSLARSGRCALFPGERVSADLEQPLRFPAVKASPTRGPRPTRNATSKMYHLKRLRRGSTMKPWIATDAAAEKIERIHRREPESTLCTCRTPLNQTRTRLIST
jgi:hypothetical protein